MLETQVLIFESSTNKFAIDLDYVLEIVRMPKYMKIPNASKNVRGIMNLRDRIIPLIDLRRMLGFQSLEDEAKDMIDMLKEREQDHINWVDELIASVKDRREFKLTTDPRMCKFGKWFYSFKTNNIVLANFLTNFEKPHNNIHALGIHVKELEHQNKFTEAMELCIEGRDKELASIKKLFAELYILFQTSYQEFAVIINTDGVLQSFNADKIDKIATISQDSYSKLESTRFGGNVKEVINIDNSIVLKLDIVRLLSEL
jgi:chemotaxis signal transduction protein